MALKKCKECGHGISKKAKTCPNCGAVKKRSIFGRLIKYSLIGFVSLGVLGVLLETNKVSNMTPEEKAAYDAKNEQRKADQKAESIAKAAEKAKADDEARVIAEAEAAEKAKADEEARLKSEADKAKADEEAQVIAEAEAAEKAKADEEARVIAEEVAAENDKAQAEIQKLADNFLAKNEAPWVRTTGTVTGDYTIDVVVETNIPFDFKSGISIGLSELSGDDIAIGVGLIRFTMTDMREEISIDVRDHWREELPFPGGVYELEAYFYNRWKENKEVAELLGVTDKVGTVAEIELVGSGESAETLKTHNIRKSWIMLNVGTGDQLTDTIFSNLPDLTVIGKEKRNASVDFVHWYTPSANVSIIVNNFTKEIVTWKNGRDF